MLGRSCCLVPFGGLVAEVVRFKMAKAILLVILLIVALNSCGQWFLASRTFSNTPAKTFRDKGCIRWRVTGFGTLLLTTVVSPIVSDVKWWSSKAIWGDTVASSRERLEVSLWLQLIWVQMCWAKLNSFLGNLQLSALPFLFGWQLRHNDDWYCWNWKNCKNRNTSFSSKAVVFKEVRHHCQLKMSQFESLLASPCCG